jgi:formate dehydrogenase subunit gamma
MIASGVMLMFPFFGVDLEIMGWIMLGHATLATVLIAIFIGHIYIGTVGMQGAIWAMWGGEVDRNWAEEHHELWLKDLEARGDAAREG